MTTSFIIACFAAFFIGVSKAGIKGIGFGIVALMAYAYGAKASTGLIVPLLIVGDVLAVIYYNRQTQWKYLAKFLPATVLGVLLGVWFGKDLPEEKFRLAMGIIILASGIIMLYRELRKNKTFPNNWFFAGSLGVASGFTTMVGNLAGGFSNLFFLATQLPKNQFIATSAWLFMIINIFKLPFHIFSWKTVTMESFKIDLMLIPLIFVGFYIGLKLVGKFSEKGFRYFIIGVIIFSAVLIFLK